MKNILVLWSSPNADGLTAAAMNSLTDGIREAGAAADEVCLNALRLEHCRACGNGWGICRKEGACVIDDDFAALYDRLAAADGAVLVTAVYWQDTTECTKAFLDRLRRCDAIGAHRIADKRFLLAACAGGSGLGTIECLHRLEETLRHMNARACDRLGVTRFNRSYMLPALKEAGRTYAERLEAGFDGTF